MACHRIPVAKVGSDGQPWSHPSYTVPVVNVGALHVFRSFDPAFDVDVAHLFAGEERVVFEYDIVGIPDDYTKLVAANKTHIDLCCIRVTLQT